MGKKNSQTVDVARLHEPHPRIRAADWRSPLINRLLDGAAYRDGNQRMSDSYRPMGTSEALEGDVTLHWTGLNDDYAQCTNSYQIHVLTEFATLGLACILVALRAGLEITEVTQRGDRADYWIGEREFLIEIGGQTNGNLQTLLETKRQQLLENPFGKPGFVCVAVYKETSACLWYFPHEVCR